MHSTCEIRMYSNANELRAEVSGVRGQVSKPRANMRLWANEVIHSESTDCCCMRHGGTAAACAMGGLRPHSHRRHSTANEHGLCHICWTDPTRHPTAL